MKDELEGLWSCTITQCGSSIKAQLVPSGDFTHLDLDERNAMFEKTLKQLRKSEYLANEGEFDHKGNAIEILISANSSLQRTNAAQRILPEIRSALSPHISVNENKEVQSFWNGI